MSDPPKDQPPPEWEKPEGDAEALRQWYTGQVRNLTWWTNKRKAEQ